MDKSITYYICLIFVMAGAVMFLCAVIGNLVYVPRADLVSDCTYEMQHEENGPVCTKLHNIQRAIGNLAIAGLFFVVFFATAGWLSERKRLKRKTL